MMALAMGLGFTGLAFGQATTGSIFGTAPAGVGETVQAKSVNGTTREVSVDANGRYTINNLPVGRYTVTLRKEGQVLASQENVGIAAGGGTEVPFTAANAQNAQNLGAVQVVASALPAIDVTSVNSSTVITAADLQRLPVGRSAESIALLAPGTVQGSGYFRGGNAVSFGGAGVTENAYYVNGYNTTEPYRYTGGFQLPYGAIDQQQTFTGGYSAQYGRSDGGVINQIGKRGTNEWRFGGQVSWAPSNLAEGGKNIYYPSYNLPAGYEVSDPDKQGTIYRNRSNNKSWNTIYSAYVGGPVIKDKLYLFLAAETSKTKGRNVRDITIAKDIRYSDHKENFYGKLDWNIDDNNVFEFTALQSNSSGDTVNGSGATYDYDYATGKTGAFAGPNNVIKDNAKFIIGKYTGYLSENATLSITYGKGDFENPYVYPGASPLPYIAGAGNQRGGGNIVNSQLSNVAYSPNAANHSKGLRVDYTYQLGTHQLGVGIDNMTYSAKDQGQAMSGPGYYWSYAHAARPDVNISTGLGVGPAGGDGYYVMKRVTVFQTSMSLEQKAYYLQDVWNVTDNLQLNLGVRNDRFTNYNDLGKAFVDEKNQWEPRLGASWDVHGDSSFKVYGNVGRYYLALPDNAAERAANRSTLTREYFNYTSIDANGVPQGLTPIGGTNGAPPPGPVSSNNELGQPKDPRVVSATDLKAQYQDEYILGFDKMLGSDWVYGAKLTYRKLQTAIDDVCDMDRIGDKIAAMGLNPDDYNYGDPGCRLFNPGQTNTFVVNRLDGNGSINVRMGQKDWGFLEGAKREYKALDLYLEHPFDGKWQGRIDYTFARNRGNTEGQVRSDFGQADVSKTEDWDAWQLMQYGSGDLLNSRKHSLRIRGAYQLTPEWLLSGTLLAQSGTPKECLGFYGTDDSDPINYGGNYHWCFGRPTPPGSTGFTPWTKRLNLAVQYSPAFADHKLAFQVQVFNVLNEQKPVQIDPVSESDHYTVSNTWNQPIFFEDPRYVRFSVSYDF
jgi:outer membrane receptor for ferrienterochelin and colicin